MRSRFDAVNALTVFLILLIALPSRLTFAPLGGAGAPALVLGLAFFAWWAYYQVQRVDSPATGSQPVRTAFLVMLACFFISYVVAMTRAIDGAESSTADIGMISILSWGGILLIANDGIRSRDRFDVLVRRLIFAGGAAAALGVFQFISGQAWVDRISIPGLSVNTSLSGLFERSGFNRPAGTAIHPIEFGAVITMILPLAINYAMTDRTRGFGRRWFPVLAISLAVVLSISRSAIISAIVGVAIVAMAWSPPVRRQALLIITAFMGVVCLTIPGLLGTLTGLFTGITGDSSAQSRTGSYGIAAQFIERSPVFGRGFSTFLPKYRILDNQYLGLVIEIGLVGLLTVLGLFLVAGMCARRMRTIGVDKHTQQLGQSLAAAVGAGAIGLAFYDGFGFPMATGILFLILGLAGAGLRLVRAENRTRASHERSGGMENAQREW